MDAKLQRWVQRHGWDRAIGHYEEAWRDQLRPAHRAVIDSAAPQPGESVIDIACGTGMVTFPAARSVGPSGSVVATDLSQRMVDDTARRANELGLVNVAVERRGAEDLGDVVGSIGGDGFDVALCALGLMYVPEPGDAIREIARVLRPGGRTAIAVWGERRNCGWADIFPIVDARVDSDVCPMFFGLGAPGALAGEAEMSGLAGIDEARIVCDLAYDDAESALDAMFRGGPVALAYSRFDDDARDSAHAEYLASIEPFRDGHGYRIPGEFVIVGARAPERPAGEPCDHHESAQQARDRRAIIHTNP